MVVVDVVVVEVVVASEVSEVSLVSGGDTSAPNEQPAATRPTPATNNPHERRDCKKVITARQANEHRALPVALNW